jgi:hypothetical protein
VNLPDDPASELIDKNRAGIAQINAAARATRRYGQKLHRENSPAFAVRRKPGRKKWMRQKSSPEK